MTSVRGAGGGGDRGGATDVVMLLWKQIEATPGITRDQILAKQGPTIPLGYARRRYQRAMTTSGRGAKRAAPLPDITPEQARGFIVTHALRDMRRSGSVERDAAGGYRVKRAPRYVGDAAKLDHTHTKAGEHLAAAYAQQKLWGWYTSKRPTMTGEERAALHAFLTYGSLGVRGPRGTRQ